MYKYITKFITIAFVASITMLLSFGVGQVGLEVGQVLAYYDDTENSNNNAFEAGIIDFTLRSAQGSFVPPGEMNPGESVARDIYVTKADESNNFKYRAYSEPIPWSCDQDLYNALELKIWYNWYDLGGVKHMELKYNGLMRDFNDFDTNPDDPELRIYNNHPYYQNALYAENEHWLYFYVTLPANFDPGSTQKTCAMNFVFDGWQTRHNYVAPLSGFHDTEKIQSIFTAKHHTVWRAKINKVYYNVDANHGAEPANEWIEIYNDSDSPIDIMDWTIENRDGSDVISDSALIIPSYGFALITGSATTWDYWDIPGNVKKIILSDGTIGSGLNNDVDMLILRDNHGNIVDQMNWGTPNLLWPNYNLEIWNPGCPDVAEGRALGRDPNGHDTDAYTDFIEFGFPEIEDIRVYQDGDLVVDMNDWHSILWGDEPATIEWTVENPFGPHSDISIDILYIEDTYPAIFGNGKIDSLDSVSDIALNIANPSSGQGSYYWDNVPHFLGYVWFEIVATNTKNFMFSSTALSYRVFEPIRGEYTVEEILELLEARGANTSELADAEEKLSASPAIASGEGVVSPVEPPVVEVAGAPAEGNNQLSIISDELDIPADSHSESAGEESLGLSQDPLTSARDSLPLLEAGVQNDEDGEFDEIPAADEPPADTEPPVDDSDNLLVINDQSEAPAESESAEAPAEPESAEAPAEPESAEAPAEPEPPASVIASEDSSPSAAISSDGSELNSGIAASGSSPPRNDGN